MASFGVKLAHQQSRDTAAEKLRQFSSVVLSDRSGRRWHDAIRRDAFSWSHRKPNKRKAEGRVGLIALDWARTVFLSKPAFT